MVADWSCPLAIGPTLGARFWVITYDSGGHKTQTQSALIVDGENIYSLRLCQRRALQRTLLDDLAN